MVNLTLTGYNSEYSDRPFTEKRDMKGGLAQSQLRMNQGLGLGGWTEDTIRERAKTLAERAVRGVAQSVTAAWRYPNRYLQCKNPRRRPAPALPTEVTLCLRAAGGDAARCCGEKARKGQ